jgi:hypothetical protein
MRILFLLLTFLLFAGLLGFVVTNLETEVPVRVFETVHEGVPLYLVGILAVFVGIVYAGVLAVAEGANVRLANRRMAREIQKLETEINYLRTQPSAGRPEPDSPGSERSSGRGSSPSGGPAASDRSLPTAPVYGADDGPPDDDDDMYSGGHAV